MRFPLDLSTDARILQFLRERGHDATRIAGDYPTALTDRAVLTLAHAEQRILITDDRDFGELVFRLQRPHAGVIFLRLGEEADLAAKIARLDYVLTHYADRLDQFLVVTSHRVRIRPRP
jgi:predicted nuclease of predicted toxin-antitoxin system